MYSISHNNIVGIYNHFEDDENCYLVIEYAGGGQVYSKMLTLGGKRFPEPEAAKMVYELCLALDYLHKRSIIHRDIKPENLLLSDGSRNATLKLADFGWSNFEDSQKKRQTYCGTVDYLAPEMADRQHKHDRGVDIWCVGVLIFEMLTGKAPFSPGQKPGISVAQAQRQTKKNIIKLNYNFPNDFPMFAKDLVKKILTLDPGKRLTIPKILKHPWFKQNKVGLGMSSPSKPSEKMDRYDTDQKEDFKHYVQNRIAESIMPGQGPSDFKTSGMSQQNGSPFTGSSPNSKGSSGQGKIVKSTQFSFTPEELAKVIRPQSILGNKEANSKYMRPPKGLPKSTMMGSGSGGKNPYMNKAVRSQNPYTQDSRDQEQAFTSHRNSANRERNLPSGSNSKSKSQSKRSNSKNKETRTQKASRTASSKKELQKLFMVLKSKDEEIERLKLKILQLHQVEKINTSLTKENSQLQQEIDDFNTRENTLIEKVTSLEASNVRITTNPKKGFRIEFRAILSKFEP